MNRLRSESSKTLKKIICSPNQYRPTKYRFTTSTLRFSKNHRSIAHFKSIGDIVNKRLYTTNAPTSLKELSESFLNGSSAYYVEQMYESWKSDPSSVHVSWAAFFHNMESGAVPGDAWVSPPTLGSGFAPPSGTPSSLGEVDKVIERHYKLMAIVRAYQVRGHELANIDPLGILHREKPTELLLETYGLSQKDMDTEYFLAPGLYRGALGSKPRRTLREILSILEQTYCCTIGVEYMHIQSREQSNWIRDKMEQEKPFQLTKEEKHVLLDRLMWANNFETFLKTKYGSAKRYVEKKRK